MKSIIGIATYSALCDATNRSCATRCMSVAEVYKEWVKLSAVGVGMLAGLTTYQVAGQYNLIWDKVFGFGLFSKDIDRECAMILAPNSTVRQRYSWYLDDRSESDKRRLTNAGWSEWTAAMCGRETAYGYILVWSCSYAQPRTAGH